MSTSTPPRNAAAIVEARKRGDLRYGDCIVASFVGSTSLAEPHVFVDPGKRYDWRFAEDLHVTIVVKPGIDAAQTIADICRATVAYPSLVDFERQVAASLVPKPGGGWKPWARPKGGESWRALFG